MEGLELICFQIISNVGMARSKYIEAVEFANQQNETAYEDCMKEGDGYFEQGHLAHAQLIQQEASGDVVQIHLLLLHAEDQLMSAESFKILASQFHDVYQKIGSIGSL